MMSGLNFLCALLFNSHGGLLIPVNKNFLRTVFLHTFEF